MARNESGCKNLTGKSIILPKATATLIKQHTVRIDIHENVELTSNDILLINKAKNELIGEDKYVVLFVPCEFGTITPKARRTSASEEVYRNAIAKAIIVKHLGNRLIANFFITINKPPAPTKLFADEDTALKWLGIMERKHSYQKELSL